MLPFFTPTTPPAPELVPHCQSAHEKPHTRAAHTRMSVAASVSAALTLAGALAAGELGRLDALPRPDAERLAATLAAVAAAVFEADEPEPARRQSSATYALQWARCALHYDRGCRMAQLFEAKALDRLGKAWARCLKLRAPRRRRGRRNGRRRGLPCRGDARAAQRRHAVAAACEQRRQPVPPQPTTSSGVTPTHHSQP